MRFRCNRARLAELAGLVGQAVSNKSTKKIFECMRLKAEQDALELTGTDLEVALRQRWADVEVEEEGECVVPAALFAGLLREIGDELVTVNVARQKLTIETDGGFFELEGEDPAQFPEIPEFPPEATGTLPADALRALVRKTTFAAGKEAARFVLNGVRVLVSADSLRFVATDGRRLATLARPLERTSGDGSISAIVGVRALHHFERVCASVEGSVEVAVAERFVALRAGGAEVTARVMEGIFPDHEQIVPKECKGTAVLPVAGMLSRLRQVAQFTSVESQSVVFDFRTGELTLTAAGGDGRAQVRTSVEYEGPDVKIGFNPAFLLDALKVVDGESVSCGLNGSNAAARFSDESGFLYVLMPVLVD